MTLVDKLLAADVGKITALPTGTKEIKRLSEITGEPFIVKYQAVTVDVVDDINELTAITNKKGEPIDIDFIRAATLYVIEGFIEPNLKDEKLAKHFGAATPEDLVHKLFLPGEVMDLYKCVSDISGFQSTDEEIAKLKNSSKRTRKRS